MKKSVKLIIICGLVLMIIFFDIFVIKNIKGKKIINNIADKLMNYDSYNIVLKTQLYLDEDKSRTKNEYIIDSEIDVKNNRYSLTFKENTDEYTVYGEKDYDKYITYQYLNFINKWQKAENDNSIITAKQVGKMLNKATNIRCEKTDLDGLKKYSAYVDLNDILPFSITSEIDEIIMITQYQFNEKVKVYIYINEDDEIDQLSFDLNDYFKNNNKDSNLGFRSFDLNISFSKFNEINEINIPDDVRNNLYVPKNHDNDIDEVTEETVMYNIVIAAAAFCQNGTIDFTNYNHELDDYLIDKRYAEMISSGSIKIDDSCHTEVTKNFIINNKTCIYKDSKNISCK